ncbi:MAG: thiamine-phosphate kinase [Nitrospirales bacterium]|nr:thiamine-phosphate kinase [Nitrospira sp.]MDR4502383.1 thiamine-phosphate kinase [Nitrospirales bacterium]
MPPTPSRRTVADTGEFEVIRALQATIGDSNLVSPYGIGDDAAVLPQKAGYECVISKDLFIEGIHFDRRFSTFSDIGYKATAVNVSDMAAMGAAPLYLLAGLAVPSSCQLAQIRAIYRGIRQLCKRYDMKIVGGDTCASRRDIVISLTILGSVKTHHALSRGGAKRGDLIFVTGTLGDSGAGLRLLQRQTKGSTGHVPQSVVRFLKRRHLQPSPKIHLGQLLAQHRLATAAIDLSDGLSGDISHLCRASHVGALIDLAQLPVSRQCSAFLAAHRNLSKDLILHWGEDYELLFTVPSRKRSQLESLASDIRQSITCIGSIRHQKHGISLRREDGSSQPLTQQSYTHFHS